MEFPENWKMKNKAYKVENETNEDSSKTTAEV